MDRLPSYPGDGVVEFDDGLDRSFNNYMYSIQKIENTEEADFMYMGVIHFI